MKKFIRIEKVKKFLDKKQKSKDKTLKRKNQRQNKKLGSFIWAFFFVELQKNKPRTFEIWNF